MIGNSALVYPILAALLWSGTATYIKILALPVVTLCLFRLGIPAISTGIQIIFRREAFTAFNRFVIIAALFNAIRIGLFALALQYTSVGLGIVSAYTSPIWSTLLAALFLQERLKGNAMIGLLLGFLGVSIICFGRYWNSANASIGNHLCGRKYDGKKTAFTH
jgi:drug/metabolite transporter (DMT)-like permease